MAVQARTKPKWADGLNDREQAFVEAYRATLNASEAARQAGYSVRSAAQLAHEIMQRPRILQAIDLAFADGPGITRTALVDDLARMRSARLGDFFVKNAETGKIELAEDFLARDLTAVQEIRTLKKGGVRLKLYDRHRSIELLGKALGLNKERPLPIDDEATKLTPTTELARRLAFLLTSADRQGGQG